MQNFWDGVLVVPQPPSTADVPEITTAGLLEAWLSLNRNFTSWAPFRGMEGHTAMRFILVP